jgi:uncharacterized RDD family membrane protein YckC
MYCSRCGATVNDAATFCSSCGHPLLSGASAPGAVVQTQLPNVAAVPARPRVEYAGFWIRFLAYLIDSVILGLGFLLVVIPIAFLFGLGDLIRQIHPEQEIGDAGGLVLIGLILLAMILAIFATWLYHALMESSSWQATVGKKVLDLVVTDMEGKRVSFGRSTGRHFAKIITNMIPLAIGYILAGFTERKQAVHDMISGCLILRKS